MFQLGRGVALALGPAPTLHGVDGDGDALWAKSFDNGQVRCSASEAERLREIRIEHPYIALRQGVRFASAPAGLVRIEPAFFGDCQVDLSALGPKDLGSHLVLRSVDQESYLDAAFHGRAEQITQFEALQFQRIPTGNYSVALFREDPLRMGGEPYLTRSIKVLAGQECAVALGSTAAAAHRPGQSDWQPAGSR